MAIQHRNIPDAQLHEPKGVASAAEGRVYHADGSGSGEWKLPKLEGQEAADSNTVPLNSGGGAGSIDWTDMTGLGKLLTPTVLLRGQSTASSQQPSAVDTPMTITFGPATDSAGGEVSLGADGVLTINETGIYTITVYVQYGRTGNSGEAVLLFRALVDGVQTGRTIQANIDSAADIVPYVDKTPVQVAGGTTFEYQLVRDSSGTDAGGLFATNPAIEGWNDTACAFIEVTRIE